MLTALWQAEDFREHDWVCELFGQHIDRHVYDGNHSMVLDNCILFDKFIHKRPLEYYEQFKTRTNVFLFHMSDEQYHGGYGAYQYFDGIFRNYWSGVFADKVMILPLGYSNGVRGQGTAKPASTRKYVWSFVGEIGRASRPEMMSALKDLGVHRVHATDSGVNDPLAPTEYREILEHSVFAPSPMGRLNLECFRLYEALECGCIPIVEKRASLDYFASLLGPHPLISISKWTDAATIIKEWSGDAERIDRLQAEIGCWWQSKKEALKNEISSMLGRESAVKSAVSPTRLSYQIPLWQVQELLRHQSAMALTRRLKIQLRRAVSRH